MRIILEGCDGTGKTTLAKILAYKYGLDICHCTQKDAADFDFYFNTTRKDDVIWDRHTIGELIYPIVFNRQRQINEGGVEMVIEALRQQGGKIFVLTADDDVIKERLLKRGNEHSAIIESYKEINGLFKEYAKRFSIPVIDTSKMTLDEIFKLMEE